MSRNTPKDWDFTGNNVCLVLYAYKPINEEQAEIKGTGKIWNDRVRVGDSIIINLSENRRGRLIVDKINFLMNENNFDATVTLGDIV